jgi:hypothetical protein
MTTALDWTYAVAEIPSGTRPQHRDATAEERAHIAAELGLISCNALAATYTLRPAGGGRYRLEGTCEAAVVQPCVVSLEPVPASLSLPVSVLFSPDADQEQEPKAPAGDDAEILSLPEVEPIEHGRLDVGRVVFETLAAGLDPYPRRPDAAFGWEDPKLKAGEGSAFAVLSKLKPKA